LEKGEKKEKACLPACLPEVEKRRRQEEGE